MIGEGPKYSVILPTYNSINYLPTCIDTILSQKYTNFELIISNNCSTDGTSEYLESLNDPRITIYHPETFLTLGDHWNFAISKASGEWLICLGSDDGLLPFFFDLADLVTKIAQEHGIKIIKTNRVYYFWPGVQDTYGNIAISYNARAEVSIKSTKKVLEEAIYGNFNFVDLPQMYTSSMFNRSVLQKVFINSTNKKYIQYNSQDAYLGVSGCIYEDKYLDINMPFGWVGCSPNSIGLNDSKSKEFIDFSQYDALSFPAELYKTINSTELLLVGSLISLKKHCKNINIIPSNLDFTNIENVKQVLVNVYQKIIKQNNNEIRLTHFIKFLTAINLEKQDIINMSILNSQQEINIEKKSRVFSLNSLKKILFILKWMYHKMDKILYYISPKSCISLSKDYSSDVETMQEINKKILSFPETNTCLLKIKEIKKIKSHKEKSYDIITYSIICI